MNNRSIIVFLKTPVKGEVKTRLADAVGYNAACSLYRAFISDTISACSATSAHTIIAYTGTGNVNSIREITGEGYQMFPQEGDNLGERMYAALARAFSLGYKQSVLIGSDIPQLNETILARALFELNSRDVVLGPSVDGGYYLIGCNSDSLRPELFSGIPWSTSDVFALTENRIKDLGLSLALVPECNDIDDINDLIQFYNEQKGKYPPLKTVSYLLENSNILTTKV